MTHPAVRAVASDHEVGPGLGLHPRDIPKSRRDGALFLGDTNQLHALFDNAAELAYPSAQQHLGLVLGKVEDESVSRAVPGHVEDEQIPVFGVHMEATHPLAILAVGLYGEVLPNQNGAPIRLVVPWKYGFKGVKSIVRIRFVENQPRNTWQTMAPSEYGFYANVNPNVDHPRWSQARERRLPSFIPNHKTEMFNGYTEQVEYLYKGMDLRKNF